MVEGATDRERPFDHKRMLPYAMTKKTVKGDGSLSIGLFVINRNGHALRRCNLRLRTVRHLRKIAICHAEHLCGIRQRY